MNKEDVTTMADVDTYRFERPKDHQINSRYGTLVELYGRDKADKIMRELEVKSW